MSNYIHIENATFDEDPDRATVWKGYAEFGRPGGGDDEGRVMVALDVDGQFDIVYATHLCRGGDIAALDRAISAMQKVRAGLADLYGGRNDPGDCWEQGDTGRCRKGLGHEGGHRFPTEAEMNALLDIKFGRIRAAKAAAS